jgi:hypothetical protein
MWFKPKTRVQLEAEISSLQAQVTALQSVKSFGGPYRFDDQVKMLGKIAKLQVYFNRMKDE